MLDVPGVSMELCGGTHVTNTQQIGAFKVLSETGIASGVRRIEVRTTNRPAGGLRLSPKPYFRISKPCFRSVGVR